MSDKFVVAYAILVIFLVGFLVGSCCMKTVSTNRIEQRALANHYAEYNSTNGNFQYIDKTLQKIMKGKK